VVVGALDENPLVRGKGVLALRAAGVDVVLAEGALHDLSAALAAPFFSAIARKRPWVVLKIAASLDGRVATGSGASRWITGPRSRALVHALRDRCDAVLVGAGTVLKDDPALTVRDVAGRDPVRVILDRTLAVPASARALQGGAVVVTPQSVGSRADALRARGASLVTVPEHDGHLALPAAFEALCTRGLHAVLVEAGPRLATALLGAGLVDELWWFQAPMVLGADAVAAFGALGLTEPGDGPRFEVLQRASFEGDSLTVLAPAVSSAITPAR
jgi:diaminohydroxyphosphoribosylaminopyrimidine deaminase / 5-amino-6-(5-phosphoribosylamino)uracil reductase